MLIEISGMQKAGKSTLIEGLTFNFNYYKFPMGGVCKYFNIQPTWEMQIAKDISALSMVEQVIRCSELDDIPMISDRGPLSTIYYSMLFNRTYLDNIRQFIIYLKNCYRSMWHPVWVEAKNQPELKREKNDGFDKLQDNLDPARVMAIRDVMFNLLDEYKIPYTRVYNDFSTSIEQNQEDFQSKILAIWSKYNEYPRY